MKADYKKALQKAISETDAIFSLEGFAPDDLTKAIDEAELNGRVTPVQVAQELLDYAKEHNGLLDGFLESRSWHVKKA